jgi:hypothetical protein
VDLENHMRVIVDALPADTLIFESAARENILISLLNADWDQRWTQFASLPLPARLLVAPLAERGDEMAALAAMLVADLGVEAARAAMSHALPLAWVPAKTDPHPATMVASLAAATHYLREETWLLELVHRGLRRVVARHDLTLRQKESLKNSGELFVLQKFAITIEQLDRARLLISVDDEPTGLLEELETDPMLVSALEALHSLAGIERDRLSMLRASDALRLHSTSLATNRQTALEENDIIWTLRSALVELENNENNAAGSCLTAASVALQFVQRAGLSAAVPEAVLAAHGALPDGDVLPSESAATSVDVYAALVSRAISLNLFDRGTEPGLILLRRRALELTPASGPGRLDRAARLAVELVSRDEPTEDEIFEGEALQRDAVQRSTSETRAHHLTVMGSVLSAKANAGVDVEESFREALALFESAVAATTNDPSALSRRHALCGGTIQRLVDGRFLPPNNLVNAIEHLKSAASLAPENGPGKPRRKNALSSAIADAVRQYAMSPGELLQCIQLDREALAISPIDYPEHLDALVALGFHLQEAVNQSLYPPEALLDAIAAERRALAVAQHTHRISPERYLFLGRTLADAVWVGLLGPEALLESIQLLTDGVALAPPGHELHAQGRCELGTAVRTAVKLGILPKARLSEALADHEQALLQSRDEIYRAWFLTELASTIGDSIESGILPRDYQPSSLSLHTEAVWLTDPRHPYYPARAANQARVTATTPTSSTDDILAAEDRLRSVISSLDPSHPIQPRMQSNLAQLLVREVPGRNSESRYTEAVRLAKAAVDAEVDPGGEHAVHNLVVLASALTKSAAAGAIPDGDAWQQVRPLVDRLWANVRFGAGHPTRRIALVSEIDTLDDVPWLAIRAAGAQAGIECIEALRGHLAMGLRAPALPSGADSAIRDAYEDAARRYEESQRFAQAGTLLYSDVADDSRRLIELLRTVATGGTATGPDTLVLANALDSDQIAIYLLSGERRGVALVMSGNGNAFEIDLEGASTENIAAQVGSFLDTTDLLRDTGEWIWSTIVAPLQRGLEARKIHAKNWILVPCGYFAVLPFHVARSKKGQWIDEVLAVGVRPSLQPVLDPGSYPDGSPICAVVRAPNLPFIDGDARVAGHYLDNPLMLDDREASVADLFRALNEAPVAIISAHAAHSIEQGAGIRFAGSWLTSGLIDQLSPRTRQWIVLTACSSGQIALKSPNETIGLPTSLLNIGFRTVIGTQWPVADHAAFVALAKLLQNIERMGPKLALREAHRWMRGATVNEIDSWFVELARETTLSEDVVDRFAAWLAHLGPGSKPFADPRYWAALAAFG